MCTCTHIYIYIYTQYDLATTRGLASSGSLLRRGEIPPDKGRSQISLTPQFLAVRILTTQMGRSVLFRIVSLEKRVETLGVLSC